MEINKNDIRAALNSGSMRWSDIAPTSAISNRPYKEQEMYNRLDRTVQPAQESVQKKQTPTDHPERPDIVSSDSVFNESQPSPSYVDTANPELRRNEKPVKSDNSNSPIQPEQPKKDRTIFDLSGNSALNVFAGVYNTGLTWFEQKTRNEITPYLHAADNLNANASNPDAYRLINLYKEKQNETYFGYEAPQRKQRNLSDENATYDPIKALKLSQAGFSYSAPAAPDSELKYKEDLKKNIINNSVEKADWVDATANTLQSAPTILNSWAKNPSRILGDIENPLRSVFGDLDPKSRFFQNSQKDIDESILRDRTEAASRIVNKEGIGSYVFDHANFLSEKTITPMSIAMMLPGAASYIPRAAGALGSAYGMYSNSEAVNQNLGWRKLNDNEIPDDLQEINGILGDDIVNWSKASGQFKDKLPNLDDVLAGKNINNTSAGNKWHSEATKAMYDDAKSNERYASYFQWAKDRTIAPDEEINREYPELASTFQSVGASSSMAVGMIGNMAATWAINKATGGLLSAAGTRPISDYLLINSGNVAKAMSNAYLSVKSRESEAYSQAIQSYDKRFSENLNSKLGLDVFDGDKFDDNKLLGLVDRNKSLAQFANSDTKNISNEMASGVVGNYDNAVAELTKNGALSKETRGKLISDIKSGFLKTSVDKEISAARNHANEGMDEYLRRYMGLLPIDMLENAYISMPFNKLKIANANKFDKSLFGSVNRTSEMVTDYITESKLGRMGSSVSNFKVGKVRIGAAPEFVGRTAKKMVVAGLTEAFLEENPQQLIQERYEDGSGNKNSANFIDVLKNTAGSASSAAMALIGVGDDARYQQKIWDNFKNVIVTTGIHTSMMGSIGVVKEMQDSQKDQKAKAFVKANVLTQMQANDRLNKTNVYVDKQIQGKEANVINYLEKLAQNPPEGISHEDIKEELAIAKKTMLVANSKTVLGYANRAGGVGSENHKLLTSLIMDHENSAKQEVINGVISASDYVNIKNEEFANHPINDFLDKHNLSHPDNQISDQSKKDIFDAIASVKALDAINFTAKATNEFTRRKLENLNESLDTRREKAARTLHDALFASGLTEATRDANVTFSSVKQELADLEIPDIENRIVEPLGLSHIAAISSNYESWMKDNLTNSPVDKVNKLSKRDHDIYVDKILDMYRESRKTENEIERTKEAVDQVKAEKIDIQPVAPTYESSSDPIGETAETVEAEKPWHETIPEHKITPVETVGGYTGNADLVGEDMEDDGFVFDRPDIQPEESIADDADKLISELEKATLVEEAAEEESPEKTAAESNTESNQKAIDSIKDTDEINDILDDDDSAAINELADITPAIIATESIKHDRISRTLFADIKLPHVKAFLMNPEAFKSAKVRIVVNRHHNGTVAVYTIPAGTNRDGGKNTITGEDYSAPNNFDITNPSTWDNAYIKVEVKYMDGKIEKTIPFNIKNPGEREFVTEDNGIKKYSTDEVQALRDFRNSIIAEQAKVSADNSLELRMVNGFERGISKLALNRDKNDRAVQRGLHEVVGLIDESDPNKLGVHNLVMAYGRGEKGGNLVVSLYESVGVSNSENAGSIFITKPDPINPTGEVKIKVNKKKVGLDSGTAELIYKLAVELGGSTARQISLNEKGEVIAINSTSPFGLTPAALLHRIVNFGEGTHVGEDGKDFLKQKQFYIASGILYYGENKVPLVTINDTQKADILRYINENLTWGIDKNDLWNSETNSDNLVSDLFPGLKSHLDHSDKNSVKFAPGVEFTKEDMDITWTAWLVKNNKITSDLADGVFEPPFLFMTDVKSVAKGSENIVSVPGGAYNTSSTQQKIDAENERYETALKAGIVGSGAKLNHENILNEIATESSIQDIASDQTETSAEIANEIVEKTEAPAKPLSFFDDFGAPRLIDVNNMPSNTIDEDKAVEFLRKKLGGKFDINIVSDVISLSNGDFAQGLTKRRSIDIFDLAQEGTEFHEAYHRASLLLISRKRRMSIYDNIRKNEIAFENATDSEIEEFLAERFRDRLLTNNVDTKNGSLINNVFRRIYNAFDAYKNFTDKDIERLYRDIELGVLRTKGINRKSAYEFSEKYEEGAAKRFRDSGLTSLKTVEAKDRLINSLTYYLFRLNDIETIDNIENLDYNKLKSSILATAEGYKGNPEEENKYKLFQEVYDKFDSYFLPEIKKSVKNTGITERTEKVSDIDEEIVSKEAASHDKASYEISKRDNIRAEVKFFIRNIPESEMVNNTPMAKTDPLSGLPSFVEFELAWNTMVYELHKENTVDGMKAKIADLATTKNNPFFIMLERRLSKMNDNFLTKFWNTMYSHRHDYINTVYNAKSAKEGSEYEKSIRNISSNIDRAERELPMFWGQNMLSDGMIYSMTEEGRVFNKANAIQIKQHYDELAAIVNKSMSVEDSNKALSAFTSLLNKVAIDVDAETMDFIINNKYQGLSRQQAVSAIIKDYKSTAKIFTTILPQIIKSNGEKGNVKLKDVTPKVLLGGENSIKEYALAYAKVHPNANEVMTYGADGATLYQISSRNTVTDVIDRVSDDKEYLKSLLSVPINQGSILFKQAAGKSFKGISFGTFVKIYEEGVADQGRDYFDISPLEDYTIKMSNLLSSNIALPAMADKKTYGFIFGVKMPNMISTTANAQRMTWFNNKISYPKEAVDIFDGYYKAEFNAIKQAWQQVKDAQGNKKLLIENYHYAGPKSTKWAAGHGNGLRFRYMDSLYVHSTTPGDEYNGLIDLNAYIDKVVATRGPQVGYDAAMDEAIDRLDKKFFSENYENRSKMISSTITSATKSEMDYALSIGLIGKNVNSYTATMDNPAKGVKIGDIVTSTSYYNKSIDQAIYNANLAIYKAAGISDENADMVTIANILSNTAINSVISEFETDKLISKDLAYYANSDDKTKRLSSVLSTGTALRNSFPEGHVLHGISSFNVAELNDSKVISTELSDIKDRSYAAQVNRLMQQSGSAVVSDLYDIYSDKSRKEELDALKTDYPKQFALAEALVDKQSKAYENVNVTDATVYVSPYMYRSMLTRLGEDYFTKDMDEAFNLMESNDMSWMNDPEKYAKVADLALHPLKMVYFGESFYDGLNVPKLDKMAMFLLPKFMATGDLKVLYDKMNKKRSDGSHDISSVDMAAFSTAVKVGNDNPVSVHIDKAESALSDLKDLKSSPQSFDYLRHQLPTEPHEGAEMSIATQVQKASMGNIVPTDVYENITINGQKGATGQQLIEEWNGAMSELSDRGKLEVEKQFGLKLDPESGTYNFNTKNMYDFLAKEAENSNMPSDVSEILSEFDEKNPTANPLQALVDNAFVESKILSSILKKTVDIKAPGGMFIQMTPFGLKHSDDSSAAYKLNGGKKLRFLNPDGSMDCVVSVNIFKDILPSTLKTHEEKVNWLKTNNIIGENSAPSAMGYRIPTQGLSSISGLKITDVLPEFMGDTVILPYEFTALTGSDFDIDKLYITRYNYSKNKETGEVFKSTMNDSKENKWKQNSTKAIQNRFIDVMMAVITNPNSTNETRIPLDAVTDQVKETLATIDKYNSEGKEFEAFSKSRLSYESKKKLEYSGGKQGIPTFALAGVNHVLSQISKLRFKPKGVAKKFMIDNVGKIYAQDGSRILDWLSAMVNAHVDVAKDPYIIRMGVNANTYKMVALLLRSGYGAKTFLFLSQPVFRDVYKTMDSKGSEYLSGIRNAKKTTIEQEIEKLIPIYKKEAESLAKNSHDVGQLNALYTKDKNGKQIVNNEDAFMEHTLVNGLSRKNKNFDYYYSQLVALETFKELSPYAGALSELVKYSQVDTKKAGNSFNSQRLFFNKVKEMIKAKGLFANLPEYFNNTFIYAKLKNSAGLAENLSQGILFRTTRSVEKSANTILQAMGRDTQDNRDMIMKVNKYIDSKLKSTFFDKLAEDRGVDVPGLFFGKETLAKRLFSIQQRFPNEVKDNYFLRGMSTEMYSPFEAERPDHIRPRNNNTNEPGLTEKLKQHFSSLLVSDNTEIKKFAEDFILYQFYSTGDNHASNTVKISEYDRRDLGYYDFVREKLSELASTDNDALSSKDLSDIFINRWYDNELVPSIEHYTTESDIEINDGKPYKRYMPSIDSTKRINGLEYPLAFVHDTATPLFGKDMDGVRDSHFAPFVKIQMFPQEETPFYVLYKLIGDVPTGKEKSPYNPLYIAIDKLGSRKDALSVVEHNATRSMIKDNILPQSLAGVNKITDQDYTKAMFDSGMGWDGKKFTNQEGTFAHMMNTRVPIADIFGYNREKFDYGQDYDMSVSDNTLKESVANAIEKAISTGDYSMETLENAVTEFGHPNEAQFKAAEHMYTKVILERSDEVKPIFDENVSIDTDNALEELKTRLEAYLQPIMDDSSEYSGYFDKKEEQMPDSNVQTEATWSEESMSSASETQEELSTEQTSPIQEHIQRANISELQDKIATLEDELDEKLDEMEDISEDDADQIKITNDEIKAIKSEINSLKSQITNTHMSNLLPTNQDNQEAIAKNVEDVNKFRAEQGLNKKTVEELWATYRFKIERKTPGTTMSDIMKVSDEIGLSNLEDYLKKCY
jgi:hypothetical protein